MIRVERVPAAGVFCCLVATVALVSAVSGASASAGRRPRCSPRGAHTLAEDRRVRVYSFAIAGAARRASYVCLWGSGRSIPLGPAMTHNALRGEISLVALAGPIVAYAEGQFGVDSGCTGLVVVDAATQRRLLDLPAVACFVDAGFVRSGQVTDLVVNAGGSIAWIATKGRQAAPSFEVRTAASSGATALLDEGPQIRPGSLHLTPAGEVTWVDAGRRRFAHLL